VAPLFTLDRRFAQLERLRITPLPYHDDTLAARLADVWDDRLKLPTREQAIAAE
jgi:hypothetical protein